MLLPSALPCDVRIQTPQSIFTPSSRMLSPPPSACQSPLSANIYSTCRALQSLLTTSLPTPSAASQPAPGLASPIALTASARAKPKSKSAKITKPHSPTAASRKRRRAASDIGPLCDQENIANLKPSTPKRRCRAPPTLPLGLVCEDFEALEASPAPSTLQLHPDINFTTPSQPRPFPMPSFAASPARRNTPPACDEDSETADEWTSSDDNALVSLILDKLRLRQSDWDDCARRLGRGKDSIGERWRMLVGEGDVGLRRSSGMKQRRKNVQLMEFGPEL